MLSIGLFMVGSLRGMAIGELNEELIPPVKRQVYLLHECNISLLRDSAQS